MAVFNVDCKACFGSFDNVAFYDDNGKPLKKKNTDGLLGNRLLNGMYNYDWMIVYSIVAIFLFASNYQFVLRTPNFIQIALSVPLLFLLYRFRNPVNKNLKPYTYILLSAESVIHFAYLLLYVYNNAQFVF